VLVSLPITGQYRWTAAVCCLFALYQLKQHIRY